MKQISWRPYARLALLLLCIAAILIWACRKKQVPDFDGSQAFAHLVKQCGFGPRIPGTSAHAQCLRYLTRELKKYADRVVHQQFQAKLPYAPDPLVLTNIVASFGLDKTDRILLCAHWDSRPWADQDSAINNRERPVLGANDGASGVAVLLEVARLIHESKTEVGVDIVLFDAEDSGKPGEIDFAIGSTYFAKNKAANYHPRYGILLDMVGDKDLQIYQEINSVRNARWVVDKIWRKARELELNSFHSEPRYEIDDDHVPLLKAGMPCIDLIDFDYAYWHTYNDTPDKCSRQSLTQVGRLILELLYE